MNIVIAGHAVVASLALLLGPVNLVRRPRGDRAHRLIGRVWVAAMAATVLTSFAIRQLNPGSFSWIHGLSVFTGVGLVIGVRAARKGRLDQHRSWMRGTWFGSLGAFVGAVAVPQRDVPQLLVHHPWVLSASALAVVACAALIVRFATAARGRSLHREAVDA